MNADDASIAFVGLGSLDRHDTGDGHPERADRLPAIEVGIDMSGARDAVCELAPGQQFLVVPHRPALGAEPRGVTLGDIAQQDRVRHLTPPPDLRPPGGSSPPT